MCVCWLNLHPSLKKLNSLAQYFDLLKAARGVSSVIRPGRPGCLHSQVNKSNSIMLGFAFIDLDFIHLTLVISISLIWPAPLYL